jgi:hypothetical protein
MAETVLVAVLRAITDCSGEPGYIDKGLRLTEQGRKLLEGLSK